MTVYTYLTSRAASAVLSDAEKSSIATSITTLKTRLNSYFGEDLSTHFTFGSQTRGTILPRDMDPESDVDYMVVFSDDGYTPQTYLNKLRSFSDYYYYSSEIYQSSPTLALELNHIKFELVPALNASSGYYIPDGAGGWMLTTPNTFNKKLTDKNQACASLLKPAIRLVKFWNAERGYPFSSYPMERSTVDFNFWGNTVLADYVFDIVDQLVLPTGSAQWKKDRLNRAREIVANTKYYLEESMPVSAESEIKKLIPE